MAAPMIRRVLSAGSSHATLHRKALAAAASVVLAFSTAGCTLTGDDDADKDTDLTDTVDVGGSGEDGSGTGSDAGSDGGSDGGSDEGSDGADGSDEGAGTGADTGTADGGGEDATGSGSEGGDEGGDEGGAEGSDEGGGTGIDTGGFDTGDPPGPPDCATVASEDLMDCCTELEAWCSETYGAGTDAYTECYYGPSFDGSTGCSPWGPPVPPRAAVS